MTVAEARPAGPVSVLADGLTVAAGSSRLLRGASIYLGLLTVALAGPGIVAQLWVLSWRDSTDLFSQAAVDAANEAIGLATFLLALAILGLLAVSIEGGAIGMMLIAGRVMGRPVTLRVAVERSRKVYWRLVRAAFLVGVVELIASAIWRAATNAPPMIGEVPNVSVEPIPGAIASLPFIYSSVAIVIADDGTRAALRRSVQLARRRLRLAFALTAFTLLSGVLEGLALGSGVDLIVRVTETVHLDVTTGGVSLFLAIGLGLLIVTAAGSLVFTVAALVSAPQVVAWDRLGLPTPGLPAAVVVDEPPANETAGVPAEPAADAPVADATAEAPEAAAVPAPDPAVVLAEEPAVAAGEAPAGELTPPTSADAPEPAGSSAVIDPLPVAQEPVGSVATVEPPLVAPAAAGWATPSARPPSAWEIGASTPTRFRWMTIPMRLTAIGLWLIVVASLLGGPPS